MYIEEHISSLEQAIHLMDVVAQQHTVAMSMSTNTPTTITEAMATAALGAPQIGQEGIGSFLSNMLDAFMNLIRAIGERLRDLWDALWDNTKSIQKATETTERSVSRAVSSGAQAKTPVSARVSTAKPRQAENIKTVDKVESVNAAMATALNNGAFSEALDILNNITRSEDVDGDLKKVAQVIGDFSASLLETPEVQAAPIATVRPDEVTGGKIERRILGRVGEKVAYIETTYDRKKNPIKSIMGVTVVGEKELQQLNIPVYGVGDSKQYIPGTELVNILGETRHILTDIEKARGGKAKARKGPSGALYNRIKDIRKSLGEIDRQSNGGRDETKVRVTTDQARQIVEWGKAINEMCTKSEFCQGKISKALNDDIKALVVEIHNVEFK